MKTIKFLFAITLLFSLTFSISAQITRPKPTEVILDQEPVVPGKPISNIPNCFCCGDKIYQLQQPTIKGEDLVCKDKKNIFNTIKCEGANITWSISPASITFTGQGTSQIQIDYSSVPTGTTSMVISVQIRCGNKVVGTKIQVKVCPPCSPQQIVLRKGEDALLHGLASLQNSNFGTSQSDPISTWTYNGTSATTYSVIKFDIPTGLTAECVTKAVLNLKEFIAPGNGVHSGQYGASAGNDLSFDVRRILPTPTWSQSSITWATMPATTLTNKVTEGTYTGGASGPADDVNIDITNLIKDAITNGNNGFMLRWPDNSLTNSYRSRWFGSFDCPNTAKRPTLTIN